MMDLPVEEIFSAALDRSIRTTELLKKYAHHDQLITMTNCDGLTLLHIAAGAPKPSLARYLLDNGADINARNRRDQSPLHAAARYGHREVVELLLSRGADPNLLDQDEWTPLTMAIARKYNAQKIQSKSWQVIKLLIEAGANPHLKTAKGTPYLDKVHDLDDKREIRLLHINSLAAEQPDDYTRIQIVDEYLVKEDFFELIIDGDEHLEQLQLLTTPSILCSKLETFHGISPLHRAAGHGQLNTAMMFVNFGAPIDPIDNFGRTPLHYAAHFEQVEIMVFLLDNGHNIDARDFEGNTPLHEATNMGLLIAASTLVRRGADQNIICDTSETPYDIAKSEEMREILKPPIYIESQRSTEAILNSVSQSQTSIVDNLMFDINLHEPLLGGVESTKISLPKSDWRYQAIKARMNSTIVQHVSECRRPYTKYKISRIDLIVNNALWKIYRLSCELIKVKRDVNEKLLFHGSKFIDNIVYSGFDERFGQPDGMFGAGIYFAEHSSKSNQYTYGFNTGCPLHNDVNCAHCERKMILSQVALGKSLVSKGALPNQYHPPKGYDSVTGMPGTTDKLNYPEYAIYRGGQAYPLYEIKYRIKF